MQHRMLHASVAILLVAGLLATGGWVEAAGKNTGAQAPIDLNKADEKELTRLPGIGPAIARRIVEFRKENGPFKRVEDILKVRGIGEKSFQKIKGRITVDKKS